MSEIEKRIQALGFELPAPFKFPNPNRTGCVQVGSILFVSGHGRDLPALPGVRHSGKVPAEEMLAELNESQAKMAAAGKETGTTVVLARAAGRHANDTSTGSRRFWFAHCAPGGSRMRTGEIPDSALIRPDLKEVLTAAALISPTIRDGHGG